MIMGILIYGAENWSPNKQNRNKVHATGIMIIQRRVDEAMEKKILKDREQDNKDIYT